MKKQNSPIIHLRTGEPGAGATLHTINEIVCKHCDECIYFDNLRVVDLPNWCKFELIIDNEFNDSILQDSILFIDDFSERINAENIDGFLGFIQRKGLIVYLTDGMIGRIDATVLNKIEKYLYNHTHFQVLDADASIRISLIEANNKFINEASLIDWHSPGDNEDLQENNKAQKINKSHCFFNKALFGKYFI